MKIKSKLPDVGVTIFVQMTLLANQHGAINLSQGFPDFNADPQLVELAAHYMREGRNQYAPMPGVLELREKIAAKAHDFYGASYDPAAEITVTGGATQGLFAAISTVVGPGDEVIIFEPAYDAYMPTVRLNGGVPVFLQLKHPDYHIDWDEVRDAVTPKTKLMILNSPHNPSGAVLSSDDIQALQTITRDTDILLLSDEVYEHIIFDGFRHESLCRYPELAARAFVISSFGKTYHTTGWKVGYCLAPAALTREFQKIHQYMVFAANTPIQYALADYLDRADKYINLGAFYQRKRDAFLDAVKRSRFKALPCHGSYFQLLDYSAISDEADADFARRMTIEHGVASIPPSVFYHRQDDHRVLRFCFAKRDATIEQAGEKLCAI